MSQLERIIQDAMPERFNLTDICQYRPPLSEEMLGELQASGCITDQGITHPLDRYHWTVKIAVTDELRTEAEELKRAIDSGSEKPALNSHGVLQLCLLTTAPFHFDGSLSTRIHLLQDVRTGQKHPCEDRAALVGSLADPLHEYATRWRFMPLPEPEPWLRDTQQALTRIGAALTSYLDLRTRGMLTPHPEVKHLQRRTLDKAYKTLAEVIGSFTCEDAAKMLRYDTPFLAIEEEERFILAQCLHKSFERYAPRRYPEDAILHAIAAILIAFGLEEGERTTIVHRIRKRLQRA